MNRLVKIARLLLLLLVCQSAFAVSVSLSPNPGGVLPGGQLQFTATVSGTSNSVVIWSLSGAGCSGIACGQINGLGVYTAPSVAPNPPVVNVTATSLQDLSQSATASVFVGTALNAAVSVSPASVGVVVSHQQLFTALVTGASNTAVTWSVAGSGCSEAGCGAISSTGVYSAPATVPSPATVTITATSVANPLKSDTAVVTILPPVAVSIAPTTAQVVAGKSQQFTATVINTTNTTVIWSLAGSGCSGSACGTLSSSGLYTAPATLPSPAQVTVKATSVADSTKSASATVTLLPPVAISLAPTTAQVVATRTQQFTATVTNTTNTAVSWSVSGSGCSGSSCGIISSSGLYTAPAAVPSPAQVMVTATSTADNTKSAAATVTVLPLVTISIAPATAQVVTGKTQQFTVTVGGTSNTAVTWSVSGAGCSGAACGTVSTTGLYTAPADVPSPAQVSVSATSVADTTKSATAIVTVLHSIVVSVAPGSAQVAVGSSQQFTATVGGSSNTAVTWSVSGSGCTGAACGTISTAGLYSAPAAVPSPAQLTVTATSVADTSKSGTAIVTITLPIQVTLSPQNTQVVAGKTQQFTATVTNTPNTVVTWSVSGSGCTGAACGTISAAGLYTAPLTVPAPALVTVTAASSADSTKKATASVTILKPVAITISPTAAQVMAGKTQSFTAAVTGTTNTAVTWSLSGAGCTGATCGTISSSGLYTAPPAVPSPAQVTVTATSNADITKSASVTVTILPPVVVHISPATAQIVTGNTQQFTATVTGATNTAVTWSVSGSGCSGAACGTVTSGGLYTAPAAVPNPAQVTVTATSVADTTKTSSAVVSILPEIMVSISPSATQVATETQRQFTASVNGTLNTAVTWSVTGAGCSGSACGTISSSGVFTAPATVPKPALVTVTATSNADRTRSASASVTITLPLIIRVAPASTLVAVGGSQQFQSAVFGTANTAVTWHAAGAGCSGAECGTISTSGLYTAPATLPSPATITITAASQGDPSQTGTAILTLVAGNNRKLMGQYAFLFKGMNGSGIYQAAGTMTADGNGNLMSGLEDVNSASGPATSVAFTGSYQTGNDGRGTMTLSGPFGSRTFAFVLDALGTRGQFIEFDASGTQGSGTLMRQDPTAFNAAALSGAYVMNLTGSDASGNRIGALGEIYCKAGVISIGSLDVNDGGVALPTFAPFNGDIRVQSSGRGTVDLSIPGFEGGSFRFAIYVISANEYYMVSIDALSSKNPVFSGPAELQTGGAFSSASFNGPAIFSLSGNNGNTTQDTVGQIVFDGNSGVVVTFDQNSGGAVTTGAVFTGAYDMQINGRGTLNLDNNNGSSSTWYLYAIAPNRAFVLDASTAFVGDGELNGQSVKQPFVNSDAFGTYFFASGESFSDAASLLSGTLSFDGKNVQGQGSVTGAANIAQGASLNANQALTGSYSISSSLNDGRGTLLLRSPNASTYALWVVSPSEMVGMSITPQDAQPAILHMEQ
ncbi:beta strand repeat-containing protein [Paracidobacterium acidisoli]|uniref:BIG2 domain-containing protein n=1 Tax=Paracidobacterium acidisoli TaxID=2303751 RepID=A0A372ITP9_9BACT|nr:hypothetical protein [Paracidobacterium acidisoli]MBT9329580.1 hypothetical protein [Paracidobacterium acidisoli]